MRASLAAVTNDRNALALERARIRILFPKHLGHEFLSLGLQSNFEISIGYHAFSPPHSKPEGHAVEALFSIAWFWSDDCSPGRATTHASRLWSPLPPMPTKPASRISPSRPSCSAARALSIVRAAPPDSFLRPAGAPSRRA